MAAVSNKVLKTDESWLTKERQKLEYFTEEKARTFANDYQRESSWLRKFLQNVIQTTNVEISKKKEISNQVTVNNEISGTTSTYNNVGVTSAAQQTRRLAIKRTPRTKHEKPEIKSLILAAAAAKKVNGKLTDLLYG
jgi:hypothetical protein